MSRFGQQSRGGGATLSPPWLTLGLVVSVLALYAIAGPAPAAWVFERDAILAGEWWRLFTGHWVHSDSNHLTWNLAAFGLLALGIEALGRRRLLGGLLLGIAGVDLMLWFGLPGLSHYCGLSGVLNTLLLQALLAHYQSDARARTLVLLIGAASLGKILLELITRDALFSATRWAAVPEAHLAGWLVGALLIVFEFALLGRVLRDRGARSTRLSSTGLGQTAGPPRLPQQ